MIEGIDYFPRKRKSNKSKLWVLLLLITVGYWYFDNKQSPTKPMSTLIVISSPAIVSTINSISAEIKPAQAQTQQMTFEILENLDEVMQSYNRESQ